MTGLEKIVNRIQLDSQNAIDGIKAKSASQCNFLIDKAESEAQAILSRSKAEAEQKYEDIINRAHSVSSLEERKIMLLTKQEIIKTMISNTRKNLLSLSDKKYFEIIYKLVEKYSKNSTGVISFNKTDLSRLPADFTKKVNALSEGEISLNPESAKIDGGFILTYGGVDVNCSISTLINDNIESISDSVAHLLFS